MSGEKHFTRTEGIRLVKLAGIAAAVYLFVKYLLPIFLPFLLGAMLAVALHPLVDRLARKTHKSRGTISLCVVLAVLLLTGSLCFFAGKALMGQMVAVTRNRQVWRENMRAVWCDCAHRLSQSTGLAFPAASEDFDALETRLLSGLQTKTLPYLVKNSVLYARTLFSFMGMLLVAVLSGLMMLTDYPRIVKYMQESAFGGFCIRLKRHAGKAGGTYLKAQLTIMLVISGICILGLFLLGNSYALLAGIGIGFCDALPLLGTGAVFVPWMLLEVINGKYWIAAAYGLIYILTSLTRQVLEPRLIGDRLGIPPVLVLMSIYIGLRLYGGPGILLGPVSAFLIYELGSIFCAKEDC